MMLYVGRMRGPMNTGIQFPRFSEASSKATEVEQVSQYLLKPVNSHYAENQPLLQEPKARMARQHRSPSSFHRSTVMHSSRT